ncbi:unnamed protein product [Vitrella brassicaformis CCMP3155]|uniref:PAS domain-containing protein n=1 Tax=Vitrella brassicaformis (strain CCMP3155) TaxID=1169540 RepID=A0A0G4EGA9_VITBC|nr:unnamed protein product [Vitrella brassicaformis CCMP3155]|eukprot:CEL94422.1 unnamed protein product [Vitrella brassicaformis CCMP3155]
MGYRVCDSEGERREGATRNFAMTNREGLFPRRCASLPLRRVMRRSPGERLPSPGVQNRWVIEHAIEHLPKVCGIKFSLIVSDPRRPDAPLIGCSPGYTKMTGYDEFAFIGRPLSSITSMCGECCDVPEATRERIRECVRRHSKYLCVLQSRKANGDVFPSVLYLSSVYVSRVAATFIVGMQGDASHATGDVENDPLLRRIIQNKLDEFLSKIDMAAWILGKHESATAIESLKASLPKSLPPWAPSPPTTTATTTSSSSSSSKAPSIASPTCTTLSSSSTCETHSEIEVESESDVLSQSDAADSGGSAFVHRRARGRRYTVGDGVCGCGDGAATQQQCAGRGRAATDSQPAPNWLLVERIWPLFPAAVSMMESDPEIREHIQGKGDATPPALSKDDQHQHHGVDKTTTTTKLATAAVAGDGCDGVAASTTSTCVTVEVAGQ